MRSMFVQFPVSHLKTFLVIIRQEHKEPMKKLKLAIYNPKIVSNFTHPEGIQ